MYFLSILINNESISSGVGFMISFITGNLIFINTGLLYLPIYIANPPGYVMGILTIIPSLGAIESFIHLSQLEGMGIGLTTDTLSAGDYPMGILFIMQFIYSLVWFFLCWYFSTLFPPGSGDGKRWYFLFQKSFWCNRSSKF